MSERRYKIYIFGAGSTIIRNSFKNSKNYDILGYSEYGNINEINEFKCKRYKNLSSFTTDFNLNTKDKSVFIFAQTKSISKLIINKDYKDFSDEINVSIGKPHEIVKFVLPNLIKNKWGRILFLGSSRALKTDSGLSSYAVSKYSSLAYSKSLSKEYARFGITSNYLSLGLFESPLLKQVKKIDLKNIIRNTDTRNIGDYLSVQNAIKFIIESNYVTGSIINVDGGFN